MKMRALLLLALGPALSLEQGTATSTPSATPITNDTILGSVIAVGARATDCATCYELINVMKVAANQGDSTVASIATSLCNILKKGSPLVCKGFQTLSAPSIGWAIRQFTNGSRSSQIFCNTLLGKCDQPAVIPYTVPVPAKDSCGGGRPEPCGREPIKVVHLSDIHTDSKYTPGLSYNCSEPNCCRPTQTIVGANGSYPAGPFGEYFCDAPQRLEEALYAAINEIVPDKAFTIVTGDIVEGSSWETTQDIVINDLTGVYTRMKDTLGLVYPAIGNHDAQPVNSFPPFDRQPIYNNSYIYDLHAKLWQGWIGDKGARQVVKNLGSYAVKYRPQRNNKHDRHSRTSNLHIISINTVFWEGVNFWIYNDTMSRDPSGVFEFMVKSLQKAEDAGERAWIIGHIPTGKTDCLHDYSSYFDQIVARYSDTIAAKFWGHTHRDQFEIGYTDYNDHSEETANSIAYIAPSLSTTSGNPNFRVYSVDPETYAVLDYTVYVANLSAPDYQTAGPKFEEYYSVKSAYGSRLDPPVTDPSEELTPGIWHRITQLFEDDDAVFQQYIDRKQRGYDYKSCNGSCKDTEICQLRSAQSQYACAKVGGFLKKRGGEVEVVEEYEHSHAGEGECGHSLAQEVFGGLVGQDGHALGQLARRGE